VQLFVWTFACVLCSISIVGVSVAYIRYYDIASGVWASANRLSDDVIQANDTYPFSESALCVIVHEGVFVFSWNHNGSVVYKISF